MYTCNMGYEFPSGVQQVTRMCQANSSWSGSTPQCQRKKKLCSQSAPPQDFMHVPTFYMLVDVDCGEPPRVTNGQVSAPETIFESTATYICDLGYEFSSGAQQITRICQANMEWSDSTPECRRESIKDSLILILLYELLLIK